MNKEYRKIDGFEDYGIANDGSIWTYYFGRPKATFLSNGYVCVKLVKDGKKYNKRVNRLVAEMWLEKPENWEKMDVAHLDSNKENNHFSNLAWQTRKENLDTDHFRESVKTKNRSPILCVETGEIFPSCAAAGREIGINRYGINLCLLGQQKTAGGYHWKRVEMDEKDEK